MKKIKINRYIVYGISICFFLFAVIGNDQIALSIHTWFKAFDVVNIGNAVIKKPANWVLSYEKKKTDPTGYLYGFIPIKDVHETSSEVVYIFKKVRTDDEIVFSEIDAALKEKAKNALLVFSDKSGNKKFEVFQIFGFEGIKIKNNDSEYSINIPDLDLYIVTGNMDSLLDFNITKSQ